MYNPTKVAESDRKKKKIRMGTVDPKFYDIKLPFLSYNLMCMHSIHCRMLFILEFNSVYETC